MVNGVTQRVEFEPNRNAFFIFFVFCEGGSGERANRGNRSRIETGLKEGTTVHHNKPFVLQVV